jgi:Fe-S-cluster containining protein
MSEKEQLESLRRQIPAFACKPGCFACCGPVPWTKVEWDEIPGRLHKKATKMVCPYASEKGCEIYEYRPLLCRLFGTVPKMTCPHGCRPLVMLSKTQEDEIMNQYQNLMESGVKQNG